jgi:hypothetical protein
MTLVAHGNLPSYQLEEAVGEPERGVCIRRKILNRTANLTGALTNLPYKHYDYSKVSHVIATVGQGTVCRDGGVWVIAANNSSDMANICIQKLDAETKRVFAVGEFL